MTIAAGGVGWVHPAVWMTRIQEGLMRTLSDACYEVSFERYAMKNRECCNYAGLRFSYRVC